MKKPMFDDTASNEERLAKLEKVVKRLTLRQNKVATGLITPYPISATIEGDVEGKVLAYPIPCKGVIKKGFVKFDSKPKCLVDVRVEVESPEQLQSKTLVTERKANVKDLSIETEPGSEVVVTLSYRGDWKASKVSISLLWIPNVRDVEAKSFLIDELEELTDERV